MFQIGTAADLNDLFEELRAFLTAGEFARGNLVLVTQPADGDTVTIGKHAAGRFALTDQATHGETVTIGGKVYTFQDPLVDADGGVLIGVDVDATLANLILAINMGTGQGVNYANSMTRHQTVEAELAVDTSGIIVRARQAGTTGNAIATTTTAADGSWDDPTLTGGEEKVYTFQTVLTDVDGHVLIGADEEDTLLNLTAAINGDTGGGTIYADSTTPHPDVEASTGGTDGMHLVARRVGVALNTIELTSDFTAGVWAAETMLAGDEAWVLLQYDGVNEKMLLRAPGLSGEKQVHFGFDTNRSIPTDTYTLGMWMHKTYNPALTFYDQPGISAVKHHLAWDTAMPYWFVANAQRLILTNKISTVYASSYIGEFLPYGTPGEYPQPWLISSNQSVTTRFSSTSEDTRCFWDPSDEGCTILHTDGQWRTGGTHQQTGGESAVSNSACHMWPYYDSSTTETRYRELRDNVDGSSYTKFPIKLSANTPSDDLFGELDGAFAVPGFAIAAEDTITEGDLTYLVVQNVFRTARFYYAAILLQ